MKRVSYIFALLTFISLSVKAQTTFRVEAGVNFAKISSDEPDYTASMRTGLHVGAGVRFAVNDNFSVTADLLYTMRGAKQKYSVVEENNFTTVTDAYEETITISYIELPLQARYKFESGLYFNGGLSLAFLTGYKDEYTVTHTVVNSNNTNVSSESGSTTEKTGIRGTDLALRLGLGYEFEGGLDIGAHYTLGLSNINDISGYPYTYHHRVIGITVSYWFGK
jgi:hypothetical protein